MLEFLIFFIGGRAVAGADAPTPPPSLLPADLLQISSTEAFSKHVILVDKKERKLFVFSRDGETIRKIDELPADIGKSDGDKKRANDYKTPEGIYFLQKKLTSPSIPFQLYGKMAFTTDYPNFFDRRLGKTGNGIWLHAIPDSVPLTRGSKGCVVIRNEALEKVEEYIQLGQTPLIVYDQIQYLPQEEHDKKRRTLATWLEGWRTSWESQDTKKYLSNYDDKFQAPGFPSLHAWSKHKSRLAKMYKKIKVTLSQPFLLLHNKELIVKTLQKYESDSHVDYGVKVIHAVQIESGYKIIREEWTKADEQGETSLVSEHRNANGRPTD